MDTKTSSEIITLVLIGTTGIIVLVFFIVLFVVLYNKKILAEKHLLTETKLNFQQQLLKASLEIEERERKDIAKNLHDDIGALLSLIMINESRMIKGLEPDSKSVQLYQSNKATIANVSDSVRNITNRLYSPVLQKFGLAAALEDVISKFNTSQKVSFTFDTNFKNVELSQNTQVQMYRSILEVINNTIKHARATEIKLNLIDEQTNLLCHLWHNGDGLDQDTFIEKLNSSNGLGLSNIQSRVNSLGGILLYSKSMEPLSSKVSINIPI